jgi:benzaldehyde dehydrogenase (NAD)
VGDPHAGPAHLGPLINDRQTERVHRIVTESIAAGATLLAGGTHEGRFYQPTVLSNVGVNMPAFAEEIFGPVAPIMVFDTDEEAVALANSSEYGLAAAIHSRSTARALRMASQLKSGMVHINDQPVNCEPQVPFGGMGASGSGGRFGGPASIEEFTQAQWVSVSEKAAQYPF